jgi:hypothetical protein
MRLSSSTQQRPWDDLVPPESGYRSKLVDADQRWAFYWGRKQGSGPALLLRVDHAISARSRDLRGIAVEALRDGNASALTVTLNNEDDSDVFEYFCRRLIQICSRCSSESDAVSQMLLEIERWHEFLGRSRYGLSLEQRMGLFGELSFLDELLEKRGHASAIESWEGPEGSPQDFVFPRGFVEVKVIGDLGTRVRITSEFQLDASPMKTLYLRVFEIEDSNNGYGLAELIHRIHSRLDPALKGRFEEKLALSGLINTSQHEMESWRIKSDHIYLVDESFPALRASNLDPSVSSVQYRLNVGLLTKFSRPSSDLQELLGEDPNAK